MEYTERLQLNFDLDLEASQLVGQRVRIEKRLQEIQVQAEENIHAIRADEKYPDNENKAGGK